MQVVILCGGKGTRMREETEYRPKPLVEIGGKPIIWHIMKIYSYFGITDFILCVGYKGYMIKEYFMQMQWRNNDFVIHTSGDRGVEYISKDEENWKVTIVETGLETMTGGRLKRVAHLIQGGEFMFTYGDGLTDLDIGKLLLFHYKMKKTVTLTGVRPASNFGIMEVKDGIAMSFNEKPVIRDIVNGGFMIMNRKVFEYLPEQDCFFENQPLKNLVKDGELAVMEHDGFWTAVDTFKDIERVNDMWQKGVRPWAVWEGGLHA